FVESLLDIATKPDAGGSVVQIAFTAAFILLSLILVGGVAHGINGLFTVIAIQMTALLASYHAVLAEQRSTVAPLVRAGDVRVVARRLAMAARHISLLSRLPGRAEPELGGRH